MAMVTLGLAAALIRSWTPRPYNSVDVRPKQETKMEKLLEDRLLLSEHKYDDIPYRVKESVLG